MRAEEHFEAQFSIAVSWVDSFPNDHSSDLVKQTSAFSAQVCALGIVSRVPAAVLMTVALAGCGLVRPAVSTDAEVAQHVLH